MNKLIFKIFLIILIITLLSNTINAIIDLPTESENKKKYENISKSEKFKEVKIRDKIILFYERKIDDAIVENDIIIYQYDKNKKFLKEIIRWKENLPKHLPEIKITKEQAESMVEGEVQFTKLYIISSESDVFPIKPTPENPCWVVRSIDNGKPIVTIIDAIKGEILGYGIPPPYTAFSLTGPQYSNPCSGTWSDWVSSAYDAFNTMGYDTESVIYPTASKIQSHIQSNDTAMFYEIAHGDETKFSSGCAGDNYEGTYAIHIETWITNYTKMPFTFLASCDGMSNTDNGSLSYAFRKGSTTDTITVGYSGMNNDNCASCWSASISWQNTLFSSANNNYSVKKAFDDAQETYPQCANPSCMRFAGDENFAISPVVKRIPTVPSVTLNIPLDGYDTFNSTIIFNCSAEDNLKLSNITLYGDWSGSWKANETKELNGTSNSTIFSKTFIDGTYNWNCLAYDNDSNTDWGNTNNTFTIDKINLTKPIDNYNSSSNLIIFNCSAIFNNNLTNISLYGNFSGIWKLNETKELNGTSNYTTFIKTLTDGFYKWNCLAYDNDSNTDWDNINNTFTVDTISPIINLINPFNNSIEHTSHQLTFKYNVSDNTIITSCKLYTNETLDANDTTITRDVSQNFTGTYLDNYYNWSIKCYDSANNLGNSSIWFFEVNVDDSPVTTLNIPANNYVSANSTVFFNCSATDDWNLVNITLYGNFSEEWRANETKNLAGTNDFAIFNKTLIDGTYNWNCLAYDNASQPAWASTNRTIRIDTTESVIVTPILPLNTSILNSSSTVTFTYNVTDTIISNCSLIINNAIDQTDTSITMNVNQNFTKTLSNDNYNWSINCTNYQGITNNTETWQLTVNYIIPPPPPPPPPPPSGRGIKKEITIYYDVIIKVLGKYEINELIKATIILVNTGDIPDKDTTLTYYLTNPNNEKIKESKEQILEVPPGKTILEREILLPSDAILGEWKFHVEYQTEVQPLIHIYSSFEVVEKLPIVDKITRQDKKATTMSDEESILIIIGILIIIIIFIVHPINKT